ncbi:MAG: alkylhydroperoxidase [Pelagibaca sp.]|nr:alkylhydroperoxidase [Pelagibaca sp.]
MTLRTNYFETSPQAIQILMNLEDYLKSQFDDSGKLTKKVWELVKLRISQINQCAFCIDMHSKDLESAGETSQRMIGLSAWRDMPFYTEIERTALDWGERLTSGKPIKDNEYLKAVQCIGEKAVVDLTIAINAINNWNRIAKTFRPEVGNYKPG